MTRTGTGRGDADRAQSARSQKQRNETRQNTLQIPGCHPVSSDQRDARHSLRGKA